MTAVQPPAVRQWTVTIPAPAAWLSANQRHKRRPDVIIRAWRDAGLVHARRVHLPKLQRAHVLAHLCFPTKVRRDVHNYYPTIKPMVDGLVDYGLLPDDSDDYLTGPDLRPGPVCRVGFGEVVLTVTDLGGESRG